MDRHDAERVVRIPAGRIELEGNLVVPGGAHGVVLFAHGSGSSRHSSRNRYVAGELNTAGMSTLLLDLLTPEEEAVDIHTRELRFDVEMLSGRLVQACRWVEKSPGTAGLPVGYFGASTGAGAALMAAASHPEPVSAVVSRGGRPDLAGPALPHVRAPTLLIVGGDDVRVVGMNREAMARMTGAEVMLEIVPGATHLFEEPGKLETAARLALEWFQRHMTAVPGGGRR